MLFDSKYLNMFHHSFSGKLGIQVRTLQDQREAGKIKIVHVLMWINLFIIFYSQNNEIYT